MLGFIYCQINRSRLLRSFNKCVITFFVGLVLKEKTSKTAKALVKVQQVNVHSVKTTKSIINNIGRNSKITQSKVSKKKNRPKRVRNGSCKSINQLQSHAIVHQNYIKDEANNAKATSK